MGGINWGEMASKKLTMLNTRTINGEKKRVIRSKDEGNGKVLKHPKVRKMGTINGMAKIRACF